MGLNACAVDGHLITSIMLQIAVCDLTTTGITCTQYQYFLHLEI